MGRTKRTEVKKWEINSKRMGSKRGSEVKENGKKRERTENTAKK